MAIAHSSFAIANRAGRAVVGRGQRSSIEVHNLFARDCGRATDRLMPGLADCCGIMQNETTNQIEDRLIDFAVAVVNMTARVPRTFAGTHIAQQLLRSATSPAPNYGEARAAESRADFIHKLRIALKELNETQIWLKLVQRASLVGADTVSPLLDECRQLSRIVTASIRTARNNLKDSRY